MFQFTPRDVEDCGLVMTSDGEILEYTPVSDIKVTDDCWFHFWRSRVEIGLDLHMNGLDSPAVLHSPDDARILIAALQALMKKWPS